MLQAMEKLDVEMKIIIKRDEDTQKGKDVVEEKNWIGKIQEILGMRKEIRTKDKILLELQKNNGEIVKFFNIIKQKYIFFINTLLVDPDFLNKLHKYLTIVFENVEQTEFIDDSVFLLKIISDFFEKIETAKIINLLNKIYIFIESHKELKMLIKEKVFLPTNPITIIQVIKGILHLFLFTTHDNIIPMIMDLRTEIATIIAFISHVELEKLLKIFYSMINNIKFISIINQIMEPPDQKIIVIESIDDVSFNQIFEGFKYIYIIIEDEAEKEYEIGNTIELRNKDKKFKTIITNKIVFDNLQSMTTYVDFEDLINGIYPSIHREEALKKIKFDVPKIIEIFIREKKLKSTYQICLLYLTVHILFDNS